jgi:hypothetical protein
MLRHLTLCDGVVETLPDSLVFRNESYTSKTTVQLLIQDNNTWCACCCHVGIYSSLLVAVTAADLGNCSCATFLPNSVEMPSLKRVGYLR